MTVNLWSTETRYVANELTITRGQASDITRVGVFHSLNPSEIPEPDDFTTVDLIQPPSDLAEGNKIDVLSLIGPASTDPPIVLTVGTWQRWVIVETNSEKLIFKVDTVVVT